VTKIIPMQSYPGHPLKALNRFATDADHLARRYEQIENLHIGALKRGELIDKARTIATLDEQDGRILAWCAAAMLRFDPPTNYENDDPATNLKRAVIAARIAILVGAFPNGAPSDPAIYVRVLVENVSAIELTLPALDAAIWHIVETMKFLPTLSEVMKVVKEQVTKWDRRIWAIRDIADESARMLAKIEALRRAKT
jgi:hypothetical protein